MGGASQRSLLHSHPEGCKNIQLMKDLQTYHHHAKLTYLGRKVKKQKFPFTGPLHSHVSPNRSYNYALIHLNWGSREPDYFTREEKKALLELQRNKEFIIKPEDKGNATVIRDKEQYILESERQLTVKEHYCTLQEPVYPQTRVKVEEILNEMVERQIIRGAERLSIR